MQKIEGSTTTMTMPKRTPFINAYFAIGGLVAVTMTSYVVHPLASAIALAIATAVATRYSSIWAYMEEQEVVETYVDDGTQQLRAEGEAVIRRIEESSSLFLKSHIPTLRQLVQLRAQLAAALQRLSASPVDVAAIEESGRKIERQIAALPEAATPAMRESLRQQKQLVDRQRSLAQQRDARVRHMQMEVGRIDLQVAVLRDEVDLHGNNEEAMLAALNELTRLTEETSTWIAENADLDRSAIGNKSNRHQKSSMAVPQ